jgi:hypothetical protein
MQLDRELIEFLASQNIGVGKPFDVTAIAEELESEGAHVNPSGLELLKFVGKRKVTPKHGTDCKYCGEPILFDPIQALNDDKEMVEMWEQHLGANLMPLGINLQETVIVMDDDGQFYGLQGGMACKYGSDFNSSLRCLLLADRTTILLEI